ALFFGSMFATSFPAAPSPILQASAVATVVLNALCWHTLLAYLFSRARVRAAYSRTRRVANRIASVTLGALGLNLLVASLREALFLIYRAKPASTPCSPAFHLLWRRPTLC